MPATSKLTSGSENPFRRNSRRITSRRLTEVCLSPIGGVALPSLTSKEWGLVVGEMGRRTLFLIELGTKAALTRLDKPYDISCFLSNLFKTIRNQGKWRERVSHPSLPINRESIYRGWFGFWSPWNVSGQLDVPKWAEWVDLFRPDDLYIPEYCAIQHLVTRVAGGPWLSFHLNIKHPPPSESLRLIFPAAGKN
jgi:hypothetical protein